ncbi:MAG TPA: hypothetical protein VFB13_09195 [Reyranella sp.]|jgi:hypothetical protein|nr:hypothetical protein [Reyranella sp.]
MERDRTPTEARSGLISGRITLVLVTSLIGAVVVLGLCWHFFLQPA